MTDKLDNKQNTHLTIHQMSDDDRPREKMLSKGKDSLSDAELIAILLGSGSSDESAVTLAQRILSSSDNDLNILGTRDINYFLSFKGIGTAKAISVLAAMELGRRRRLQQAISRTHIKDSMALFEIFQPILIDKPQEEFWMLQLNRHNDVIQNSRLSNGGTSSTLVDVKIALRTAIVNLADNVAFCHNHPSGTHHPSKEDDRITSNLCQAFKAAGIRVLDHIIVCGHTYYSYADSNRI